MRTILAENVFFLAGRLLLDRGGEVSEEHGPWVFLMMVLSARTDGYN